MTKDEAQRRLSLRNPDLTGRCTFYEAVKKGEAGLKTLLCSQCRTTFPAGIFGRCARCEGILQPEYTDETVRMLGGVPTGHGIDRYRFLLPVRTPLPNLGEGDTPLVRSRRLCESTGLKDLFFKEEGCNPTGSFKDRAASLAVALALEAGAKGVLTASSGNAAAALSAYAAAAGLKCLLLLEPEAPPAKLRQMLATGAQVLPVAGVFSHGPDAAANLILQVAAKLHYYPAFAWAPVNPYLVEAMKTISFEITAQLSAPPEAVVCPAGGGDLVTGQWRGYLELRRAEIISRLPRMIAVQSLKAPPLLEAFRKGLPRVATLSYANSGISGINVAFSGEHALGAVRESGGTVVGVDDEDVFEMQRRLAREEGLWVEPASAAPVAALQSLRAKGLIEKNERIVCILSGAGFKDSRLSQAEAESIRGRPPLPFDADAITKHANV
jgi:threonine synthase